MTVAYWCVVVAMFFPYVFTILAKSDGRLNNVDPRSYLQNMTGWRKRANYVQMNSFEVLPIFGLAVIIAQLSGSNQGSLDHLALSFIFLRCIYGVCYLANKAALRSLVWLLAMLTVAAIIYGAAHH
jgi:uncharacterized MAPEG superfamily protein